jgi:hypothetical protein
MQTKNTSTSKHGRKTDPDALRPAPFTRGTEKTKNLYQHQRLHALSRLTNSKHKAERSPHNRSIDPIIHLENRIYGKMNGSIIGVLRCRWIPSVRWSLSHPCALDFISFFVILTIMNLAVVGVSRFSAPAIYFDIW